MANHKFPPIVPRRVGTSRVVVYPLDCPEISGGRRNSSSHCILITKCLHLQRVAHDLSRPDKRTTDISIRNKPLIIAVMSDRILNYFWALLHRVKCGCQIPILPPSASFKSGQIPTKHTIEGHPSSTDNFGKSRTITSFSSQHSLSPLHIQQQWQKQKQSTTLRPHHPLPPKSLIPGWKFLKTCHQT